MDRTTSASGLGKGILSGSTEEVMAMVDDLLLLAEVIEAGGMRAASTRTSFTKSRLSRRIAALEERLNVCLLTRNSRRFEVTETGRTLYEHALEIRATTRSAIALAGHSLTEPAGLLRVACPFALSRTIVTPLTIDFAVRHPRVRICLATTHGTPAALGHQFDILVHPTTGPLPDSDIVALRLTTTAYVLAASPALFEGAHGVPTDPEQLARFPIVGWNSDDPTAAVTLHGPSGEVAEVRMPVRFAADNLLSVHQAALGGLGIARLPLPVCADHLADGQLVHVAPNWAPSSMGIYVLYSSRRQLSAAGHAFVAMLQEHLHGDLAPGTDARASEAGAAQYDEVPGGPPRR